MTKETIENRIRDAIEATDPLPAFDLEDLGRQLAERPGPAVAGLPWGLPPARRWWGQAAAALVIFVLGFGLGFSRSAGDSSPELGPTPAASASLALAVQSRGSEFVTRLAKVRETRGNLAAEEVADVRESTLAVLHGAASELRQLENGEHGTLTATVEGLLASQRRSGERNPRPGSDDGSWQLAGSF